jgi:hypothetical protein
LEVTWAAWGAPLCMPLQYLSLGVPSTPFEALGT